MRTKKQKFLIKKQRTYGEIFTLSNEDYAIVLGHSKTFRILTFNKYSKMFGSSSRKGTS